jgi:hypothetical protein
MSGDSMIANTIVWRLPRKGGGLTGMILIAESHKQNKKDFSLSILFFLLIGMI